MDSENLSQLASLYALNTLDEAEQSLVAAQCAHLSEFQAEVAETEAIASMLAYHGDLVIGEQTYATGDRVYSQAGTVHQPETRTGCTLFLRTCLDDELL